MGETVTVFAPYPFQIGEKIHIAGPDRHGDWLVAAIAGSTITLRCPVSGKEFAWKNFCYLVHKEENALWPRP